MEIKDAETAVAEEEVEAMTEADRARTIDAAVLVQVVNQK